MNFEEALILSENNIILEKRSYKHRPGYKGNEKGSYIEKGKTYWDYSGGATPGNERLVTQIQNKLLTKYDTHASREKIKDFLKTTQSQKIYDKLSSIANERFGEDEENQRWRAYVFGGFSSIVAKIIAKGKGNSKKISDVL